MPRVLILDSFPLSCLGKSASTLPTLTDQCRQWAIDCLAAGHQIYVPAIVYYETLRELERLNATGQVARLRMFCFGDVPRFLALETAHLEAAASLWAQARQSGIPTAGAEALDGDVILAAQTQSLAATQRLVEDDYVVATTNVAHLARFVPAQLWTEIVPGS